MKAGNWVVKLLTGFRTELRDCLLDVLWRQWTALGVSGRGETWTGSVIDPEALLLLTCAIGRYDARLFDAVLEWLRINARFVNVQRIKRMLKDEIFSGERVLAAVAAATSTSVDQAKWVRMTSSATKGRGSEEPLFFLQDGKPLPVVREPDGLFAKHGFLRDRFEERGVAEPLFEM